jgi:diguanylate cyclase (GGDEF)-like protein
VSERREARRPPATGRRDDPPSAARETAAAPIEGPVERRRASRSLWNACEALLSAPDQRSIRRALEGLRQAFDCDGVAIHAVSPSGAIEPWCARGAWRTTAGDLRDCMSVPLFRAEERVGTLDLQGRAGQRWQPGRLALIRTAAGALGAALGARLELERLRHQPGRDPVTGLADAQAFHARLAQELARARRHGLPLALVMLDLDHFAALNTRYGRNVGDGVLAETALLLKLALRETDVLSRLGGDTFGVLLPETDQGPAVRCADRVRRTLEEHPFARVGRLTASAGVAAGPRDGVEAVELVHQADQALTLAKKSGRRRVLAGTHAHAH